MTEAVTLASYLQMKIHYLHVKEIQVMNQVCCERMQL